MNDYQMAKQSKKEEDKAVTDYTRRREQSKDPQLKQAFTHALGEEKTHSRLFKKVMEKKQYSEGAVKEARKMRGGE